MGDTLTIVVVIGLVAILMFVVPLMTMADRTDDISQLTVETATTEVVDNARTAGKLTMDQYSKYVETISSTGNAYDVEMEVKVLDENPGKKTSQAKAKKIGENEYYAMYTSQILERLEQNGTLPLKEGDIVVFRARNKSTTPAQQLKNFLYSVTGNGTYTIAAEHAGIVTANGTGK